MKNKTDDDGVVFCTCCDDDPAKLFKNYDARKYHLNNMAKKRTADSAASVWKTFTGALLS